MITGKYSTTIGLANTFFSVPLSTALQLQFAFIPKWYSASFLSHMQGTSTSLPLHTIFNDKILIVPTFV